MSAASVLVGGALVGVGLVYAFFGRVLHEFLLKLAGFLVGAFIGGLIGATGDGGPFGFVIPALVGGLVGASVLHFLYRFGIFLVGVFGGGLVGIGMGIGFGFDSSVPALLLALLAGFLSLVLHDLLLRIVTAYSGAFLASGGIALLTGGESFLGAIVSAPSALLALLIGTLGVAFQFGWRPSIGKIRQEVTPMTQTEPAPQPTPPQSTPVVGPAPSGFAPLGAARFHGPRGRVTSPGATLAFSILTLGIFNLFWTWRVTKEVEAYTGGQARPHGAAKVGFGLIGGGAAAVLVAMLALGGLVAAAEEGGVDADAAVGTAGVSMLILFASIIALVVGGIFVLIAHWRVWSLIAIEERNRGVLSPLSPGLLLALCLIPYVNIVGGLFALYRTQQGLNDIWTSGGARPA